MTESLVGVIDGGWFMLDGARIDERSRIAFCWRCEEARPNNV